MGVYMIGIFDSGSGGLTVLRAIRDVLPSANVLYFGDIKNAPYGARSREELSTLTVNAIKLLQDRGASRIVSACNSVSASLAVSIYDVFSLDSAHLIEMVGPTVAIFKGSTARILLCATQATIHSGIYQNAFTMIGKEIVALPLPELASAIECDKPKEYIEHLIELSFGGVVLADFDVLILGCTHYPLAMTSFRKVLGQGIAIYDPAVVVAQRVEKLFWPQEVGDGTTRYIISKDSMQFRGLVTSLFPGESSLIEVLQ